MTSSFSDVTGRNPSDSLHGKSVSFVHLPVLIQLSLTVICIFYAIQIISVSHQLTCGSRRVCAEHSACVALSPSDDEGVPAEKSARFPGLVSGLLSVARQRVSRRLRGARVQWRGARGRPLSPASLCV